MKPMTSAFVLVSSDINKPPTDLNSTTALAIAENQPVSTIVGEFNATDPDGDAITFSLVSGEGDTDNVLFTLDANGRLSTTSSFDYESSTQSFTIRVQGRDDSNASTEKEFTILLTDEYGIPTGMDSGTL